MLLSSGFIVHDWLAWELTLKQGGGDELLVLFSSFSFSLSPSLFVVLSISVCLTEPSWCLLDEFIP